MNDLEQARANIAAHEAAEKARIDAIVEKANRGANALAAERAAQERDAEQAREAARQAREAQRLQAERDDAERQYTSAGGDPAGFDAWWQVERQRRITERIAQQQAAAREAMRRSF